MDTHRPTCLPNVLSVHLRCMSVHLGRVKHNCFVANRSIQGFSTMDVNWLIMLGQNDHYVGTNLFFLDRVSMMAFIDRLWTSYGLCCCIPGLTSRTFWSVDKYFCTPCHHSVCKPLLWSCLIQPEWTIYEPLLPNSNGSELGESLAVVVLLWFCACEGVHNTDNFRLSVGALSRFMLESVWMRWWCLGGCSGEPCLTRFEIMLWGTHWTSQRRYLFMMILFHPYWI